MLTLKIGRKKIKVLNLLILIGIMLLIVYLLIYLFFSLPFFKSNFSYKEKYNGYHLEYNTSFKTNFFTCIVTENVKVINKDDMIYKKVVEDLLDGGYEKLENNYFKKKIKVKKSCKDLKSTYKKERNNKYVQFMLNGNLHDVINYGEAYTDSYVISKVNGKEIKDVNVLSNFNKNRVGKYLISYELKVSDLYTKRLYRIVDVVDNEAPTIKLNEGTVTLNYGQKYVEPGFNATDNYDGDITKKVTIKNIVNSSKSGTYEVSYQVRDSSGNKTKVIRQVVVNEQEQKVAKEEPVIEIKDGITYVNGILLVNKTYGLPKNYDPKVDNEAYSALKQMQADASVLGLDLSLVSGYRSYQKQSTLYNNYVKKDGEEKANTYSAKPGHSEHQTGLAFDIGRADTSFINTKEAKWIEENAHLYGFIVRYPKDKSDITGYIYEPWHVRYLGIELATKVKDSGLCLEEYLGISY